MENGTPWMTRSEAAEYARVTEQTIDAWRKAGLPCAKTPLRHVLIDRRELDAWLQQKPSAKETLARTIQELVDAAPALSDEQVQHLRMLLRVA